MNLQRIIALFLIFLLLPLPVVKASPPCEDPTEKPIMIGVSSIFYVTGAVIIATNPFGMATAMGVLLADVGLGIARVYG